MGNAESATADKCGMRSDSRRSSTRRSVFGPASWPFLAAPLGRYLLVMTPICALQAFIILSRCPIWMQASAGVVLALSLYGLAHGYLRRLMLTREAAVLTGITRRIGIRWSDVRSVGVYIPGGGVGATEYLFITTRDRLPRGKWDVDAHTIQVQSRPALVAAMNDMIRDSGLNITAVNLAG